MTRPRARSDLLQSQPGSGSPTPATPAELGTTQVSPRPGARLRMRGLARGPLGSDFPESPKGASRTSGPGNGPRRASCTAELPGGKGGGRAADAGTAPRVLRQQLVLGKGASLAGWFPTPCSPHAHARTCTPTPRPPRGSAASTRGVQSGRHCFQTTGQQDPPARFCSAPGFHPSAVTNQPSSLTPTHPLCELPRSCFPVKTRTP